MVVGECCAGLCVYELVCFCVYCRCMHIYSVLCLSVCVCVCARVCVHVCVSAKFTSSVAQICVHLHTCV